MNEQIKLARNAYDALAPLNNIAWQSYRDQLLNLCKAEEKDHRGFMPDFNQCHTSDTASVSDAAKLFAVKRIAEYLTGDKMPIGKDYLHTQKSCFMAAGLVDEYRQVIEKAWTHFDIEQLSKLDYTQVVKVKRAEAA